ncbi:spartin isoform X1 [Tachyglossus aculeatus]|uniref:spartin isoform X1 n=1 Tax=Tachyglossus aculeatus TaxID=9261 RepID=UPI0018F4A2B1|nr:spartin isoform X1 [Tachyglossus aculeatus]XP_038617495.1 spartin isoform X1 [Tachyglossus aculeatus]XP_038617499.1 spartin isoform X1 [Tachyglossus aculeatus]
MEPAASPETEDPESVRLIKEAYKKAFQFVNKGLNTDELGQKEEAKRYYKQGLEHLHRGISIPSAGSERTGPQWDSARQMQRKMQETLQNVNSRLGILDQSPSALPDTSSDPQGLPKLYPALPPKPDRPPLPQSLISPPQSPKVNGKIPTTSVGPASPPSSDAPCGPGDAPPAYTPQAADGHYTVSYGTDSGEVSSVGEDYYANSAQPPPLESLGVDAEELILIPSGVQIFFVTPEGQVSAPSYPGYLRIVKFLDTTSEAAQSRPPGFLQVCDWLYPLLPNQSPVLSCSTGVYMFPDAMSQVPGSYVGVVLSSELPTADRELFEDLLQQMSDVRIQAGEIWAHKEDAPQIPRGVSIPSGQLEEQSSSGLRNLGPTLKSIKDGHRVEGGRKKALEASSDGINLGETVLYQPEHEDKKPELPEWSEKVAHGILSGASWVSWGLVKGAEYTGKAIQKGASKLREHIRPEEKPLEVSPTVSKGLHMAKQATGGAMKVSQLLVEGVCSVASCVGRELAPHVKKHGSKLVPESLKKDKDGKSPLDGAMVVAASGVQGFSTVWQGLECAAKCIVKSVSEETVHTVKHKYGAQAGNATDNAMNSAINVGVTAFNIDNIGIKAMVKKTAKQTGHAILEEYKIVEKSEKSAGEESGIVRKPEGKDEEPKIIKKPEKKNK